MRGVRVHNDLFLPPNGSQGWPIDVTFNVVYSRDVKRKNDNIVPVNNGGDAAELAPPVPVKRQAQKPSDLAVLSIPWKTSEDELKEYFGRFGTVVFANIKKDAESGHSRGFGFIRFETYEAQKRAMEAKDHEIQGRQVVLRLTKKGENCHYKKVFVGRLSTELSRADLMDYFSQFGTITDITIPQPFRSFAFITFQESSDAISILDQDHLIKGVSVVTRSADPIQEQKPRMQPPQTNVRYAKAPPPPIVPTQQQPMPVAVPPPVVPPPPVQSVVPPPPVTANGEYLNNAMQRAISQAVQQAMHGFNKRPGFGEADPFYGLRNDQVGPSTQQQQTSPSSLYGFGATSGQSKIQTTGVTRGKVSFEQGSSNWSPGTSPGHNPWEASDPQSKNYTHGKQGWL